MQSYSLLAVQIFVCYAGLPLINVEIVGCFKDGQNEQNGLDLIS